jgi:hypothetical protein
MNEIMKTIAIERRRESECGIMGRPRPIKSLGLPVDPERPDTEIKVAWVPEPEILKYDAA